MTFSFAKLPFGRDLDIRMSSRCSVPVVPLIIRLGSSSARIWRIILWFTFWSTYLVEKNMRSTHLAQSLRIYLIRKVGAAMGLLFLGYWKRLMSIVSCSRSLEGWNICIARVFCTGISKYGFWSHTYIQIHFPNREQMFSSTSTTDVSYLILVKVRWNPRYTGSQALLCKVCSFLNPYFS